MIDAGQPGQQGMSAVVKRSSGMSGVSLETVAVPHVRAGFALVRVIATGVCGTDIHIAHDEYASESPVVMGHEILGTVDSVGDPSENDWLGARVVCETYFSACESCEWCRAGRRNLCPSRRSLGSFENGGFARFVLVPIINLHRLPDSVSGIEAVLSEPLACVVQCLLHPAVVGVGDAVLVTGPGTMGQLAAQVALAGGGDVTLAGLPKDALRLNAAAELGITTTTAPTDPDSFDVVIECSGSAAGARMALASVKRGGRYVQVGIFGKEVSLPIDLILYKELSVSSGFASTATSWQDAIRLLDKGKVRLGSLVTRQVPLDRWQTAFETVMAGDGIKTVIVPG